MLQIGRPSKGVETLCATNHLFLGSPGYIMQQFGDLWRNGPIKPVLRINCGRVVKVNGGIGTCKIRERGPVLQICRHLDVSVDRTADLDDNG